MGRGHGRGRGALQNLVQLLAHLVESRYDLWIRDFAGQANSDDEGNQMLLRPVMEVALNLSALSLARARDACSHRVELRGR